VENEIRRQIEQDKGLTTFLDQHTASIANDMSRQSMDAARVASQYQPATAFTNPTLDAHAQGRVAEDAALTNQVGQDQAGALAALIAQSGSAGATLMGNMRGASQVQHRDHARRLEGLRPELERQYRLEQEALAQQKREEQRAQEAHRQALVTQRLMDSLAQKRYGLDAAAQEFGQSQAVAGAAADAAKQNPPKNPGVYGFGAERDEAIGGILVAWQAGQIPNKDGLVAVKNPWRDLFQSLRTIGNLTADQSALLATKSSQTSIRNAKGGPRGVITMLRNRGVSEKVQKWILRKYFGQSAVDQFFGGKYAVGGNILAPGNQRPKPKPKPKPKPNAGRPTKGPGPAGGR
jgi:hypothetical protein